MSRDCPRYTLAKAATSISVREGVLYSDALRAARIQEKQKASPPASTPSTGPPALAAGRPLNKRISRHVSQLTIYGTYVG